MCEGIVERLSFMVRGSVSVAACGWFFKILGYFSCWPADGLSRTRQTRCDSGELQEFKQADYRALNGVSVVRVVQVVAFVSGGCFP